MSIKLNKTEKWYSIHDKSTGKLVEDDTGDSPCFSKYEWDTEGSHNFTPVKVTLFYEIGDYDEDKKDGGTKS